MLYVREILCLSDVTNTKIGLHSTQYTILYIMRTKMVNPSNAYLVVAVRNYAASLLQSLVHNVFVRTNCRTIAMMFVRSSVCLGQVCIVIIWCT